MKKVKKIWGDEEWIVNNNLYCGKILNLKKDYFCSFHFHKIKDETFFVLSGKVELKKGKKIMILNPGDSVRIKPLDKHSFLGLKKSKIIEFSTEHFETDSYRLS
ncbi:MAG: cupin domain-containing protein, partial [Nitrospira sp.]